MPERTAAANGTTQTTGRPPLLEVDQLAVRFKGAPANTVDGLSFSLSQGQTLCIVGESGCGKSVSALALMGLLPMPPAQIAGGRALLDGKDLLTMTDQARANLRGGRMAMIFQEPMTSLNPAYRIGDQIAEGILRHRSIGKAEARRKALEMLERVRIPASARRLNDYPHQLSGGMRQRVMIAMALANDPDLLIADEPTTALDVTIQAQILDLIRDLQSETGTALIMITHDLGVVAEVADTVAVMYAGRIVEQGPVDAIFNDPQHPYTIGLMSSIPSLGERQGRLAAISGMVPVIEAMPQGCRFAPRCPFANARCTRNAPPLRPVTDGHLAACHHAPLETHFSQAS